MVKELHAHNIVPTIWKRRGVVENPTNVQH